MSIDNCCFLLLNLLLLLHLALKVKCATNNINDVKNQEQKDILPKSYNELFSKERHIKNMSRTKRQQQTKKKSIPLTKNDTRGYSVQNPPGLGDEDIDFQIRPFYKIEYRFAEDNRRGIYEKKYHDGLSYIRGVYGGYYRDKNYQGNFHYIHGVFRAPVIYYYKNYHYRGNDNSSLGYYLGYALLGLQSSRIRNGFYRTFHYHYNRNHTYPETDIYTDLLTDCHRNLTKLCPENTETLCMARGKVICITNISLTIPCTKNYSGRCVNTTVPCVKNVNVTSVCNDFYLEDITLPCIYNTTLIDVLENKYGMTVMGVSGTFVQIAGKSKEDSTYCVTIVVEPISHDELIFKFV